MATAARLPIFADRWTPYVATFRFRNIDLTGAAFRAQVRLRADALGTALVTLATVTSSSAQGLRLVGVATTGGITTSTVSIRIDEATIAALPLGAEAGADTPLVWDLHITPSGGVKQRRLFGPFTVVAGVTQ